MKKLLVLLLCFTLVPFGSLAESTPAESKRTEAWQDWYMTSAESDMKVISDTGTYEVYYLDSDSIQVINTGIRTSGYHTWSNFRISDDQCQLLIEIIINPNLINDPEYMVPLAISEERYLEYKQRFSKFPFRKVIDAYTRYTPESITETDNAEELLEIFPSLREQVLYILDGDIPDQDRSQLERNLAELGYTRDDYETDMRLIDENYINDLASSIDYPIYYSFLALRGDRQWVHGPIAALCSLSDQLSAMLAEQYAPDDTLPESVGDVPVQDHYEFMSMSYQVALDSINQEGDNLIFSFTVIPNDNRGLFPQK